MENTINERIDGLILIKEKNEFFSSLKKIIIDLRIEGFDSYDIEKYLVDQIRSIDSGIENYDKTDSKIPEGWESDGNGGHFMTI